MFTYLGQVHAIMEEFENVDVNHYECGKHQEHKLTLFLILTLVGLHTYHDSVRDQVFFLIRRETRRRYRLGAQGKTPTPMQ